MLGKPSIMIKCRLERPFLAANRTAPRPVEQCPEIEILNTARSSAQRSLSTWDSKLVHRLVVPARSLPKKVTSVVRPGAIALGTRWLMVGEAARQFQEV